MRVGREAVAELEWCQGEICSVEVYSNFLREALVDQGERILCLNTMVLSLSRIF